MILVENRERQAKSHRAIVAIRPRGVTLIELLITIMIISILAAAILGVAAVAGETAREAKTKSMISRLHSLLMEHYDTYANRRVKLRKEVIDIINSSSGNAAFKGRIKAEARLYALREMMLMEVPDRWSDVLLNGVPGTPPNAIALSPLYLDAPDLPHRTELSNLYLRTYRRIASAANKITGAQNTRDEILQNQGAECLYMVIMNACGDGESRTLFPESSIGDTDGDGAFEFLDGWGHPIEFVRWAPGFESDVQFNAVELDDAANVDQTWADAGSADHDPFDLYRAQPIAFRLVPLIYSLGRDEEAGFYTNATFVTWKNPNVTNPTLASNPPPNGPYIAPPLNPYGRGGPNFPAQYFGSETGGVKTATDNINNHLITTR